MHMTLGADACAPQTGCTDIWHHEDNLIIRGDRLGSALSHQSERWCVSKQFILFPLCLLNNFATFHTTLLHFTVQPFPTLTSVDREQDSTQTWAGPDD